MSQDSTVFSMGGVYPGLLKGPKKDWFNIISDGSSSAMDPKSVIPFQIKPTSTPPQNVTINLSYEDIKFKSKLEALEKRIEKLEEKSGFTEPEPINIRDISYAQAMIEIAQFYKERHGEDFDAADIEESLGIEFEMAMQICEELEKEGKIRSA